MFGISNDYIDGNGMTIRKVDSSGTDLWEYEYPQNYYLYNPVELSPSGSLISYQELSSGILIVMIETGDGIVVNNGTFPELTIQTELYEGMGATHRFSPSSDYIFFTASLDSSYWSDARVCRLPVDDFATATCIELLDGQGMGTVAGFDVINDNELIINYVVGKLSNSFLVINFSKN